MVTKLPNSKLLLPSVSFLHLLLNVASSLLTETFPCFLTCIKRATFTFFQTQVGIGNWDHCWKYTNRLKENKAVREWEDQEEDKHKKIKLSAWNIRNIVSHLPTSFSFCIFPENCFHSFYMFVFNHYQTLENRFLFLHHDIGVLIVLLKMVSDSHSMFVQLWLYYFQPENPIPLNDRVIWALIGWITTHWNRTIKIT